MLANTSESISNLTNRARARLDLLLEQLRKALDLPSRAELEELTRRLEALDARIAALAAERVAEMTKVPAALPEAPAAAAPAPEAIADAPTENGKKRAKR
jgi:hypothetical protein